MSNNMLRPGSRQGLSRLPAPTSTPRPVVAVKRTSEDEPNTNNEGNEQVKKRKMDSSTSTMNSRPKSTLSKGPAKKVSTTSIRSTTSKTGTTASSTMTKRTAMNDRTNTRTTAASAASKPKKRPEWDVKGRLADMETTYKSTLERLNALEAQKKDLETNVEEKEVVVAQNSQELRNLQQLLQEANEKLELSEKDKRSLKNELETVTDDKGRLQRQLKGFEDELTVKQTELTGLKTSMAQMASASAGMEAELKEKTRLLTTTRDELKTMTELCSEQKEKIETMEDKQRSMESERRKLHNTIQELKGNIRVFCRVRPLLDSETRTSVDGSNLNHIEFKEETSVSLLRNADTSPTDGVVAGGLKGKNSRYEFTFDRVFNPSATQEAVFGEISQLVQSAIDGYQVCVFAYGQTGSGKTFTMEGGEGTLNPGMIPRTIEQIFMETENLQDKGWKYEMDASFLEIYNEEIRDLLATEKNLKYDIKMQGTQAVYVTNLKIEKVTTACQIQGLLDRARKNRSVASTNCNERSSRSHSVFQLRIRGHNTITTESCDGCLNLVDLAGSERLKDSGSEGQRLVETKNINKSLANLGNVIMALAQKEAHVPYRNSKLTHLLQFSLGGNSKTLMFVNISPREDSLSESLNSLRFATKVNQCQIGTATKKVK